MNTSLTANEQSYFAQIAARIATRIQKSGETVTEANFGEFVTQAHQELQAFAEEMCAGRTDRAKRASRLLSAAVWGNVQIGKIHERVETQALDDAR